MKRRLELFCVAFSHSITEEDYIINKVYTKLVRHLKKNGFNGCFKIGDYLINLAQVVKIHNAAITYSHEEQ